MERGVAMAKRIALVALLVLSGSAVCNPLEQVAHWYMDRLASHFESASCPTPLRERVGDSDVVESVTPSGMLYFEGDYVVYACFSSTFVNSVDLLVFLDSLHVPVFGEGPFEVKNDSEWKSEGTSFVDI
jgi:hypothetical protein